MTSLGGEEVILLKKKKKRYSALSKYAGMWRFAPFMSITCRLLHTGLHKEPRPLLGKGTWNLLPTTPDMLPTATKHFDRAGYSELGQSLFNNVHEKGGGSTWISLCLV